MNRYLTELVGTFFLVLAIGLSVIGEAHLAPIAIGGMLMVMVFMGGHVSGAHYNPAVSLAVFIRGKIGFIDMIMYWVFQLIGAIAAATIARWVIMGKGICAEPISTNHVAAALVFEFLITFALALVVLNVATAKGTSGNSFYGLAIGFTVVAGAIASDHISAGAFNPAVGVAITLMGVPARDIWIYVVGPLAGAVAAAGFFRVQNPQG
jgi:aquaporin Z